MAAGTSWTVGGGADTDPVRRSYRAHHKNHFAGQPQTPPPYVVRGTLAEISISNTPRAFRAETGAAEGNGTGGRKLEEAATAARTPRGVAWEEKKKNLDMLQSYDPWGKPAVGAPRITSKGKIDARRIVRREELDPHPPAGADDPLGAFGRPGGGAPLITECGRVQVALRADPDIRFQKQLKKEVDAMLRYRPVGGGASPVQHTLLKTESQKDRLAQERERQTLYAKRLEQQLVAQIKQEAEEAMEAKVPRAVYFPWGRDKPERDGSGKIIRKRCAMMTPEENQLSLPPPPPPVLPNHDGGQAPPSSNDPWGRPGCGAPLRDDQGHLKVNLCGALRKQKNMEHLVVGLGTTPDQIGVAIRKERDTDDALHSQKHQYFLDLMEQAEQRQERIRRHREEEREMEASHVTTAGHFFAEGQHPHDHVMRRSWERDQADLKTLRKMKEYCTDLQQSMTAKEQQRREERLRERELEKKAISVPDYMRGLTMPK